MTRRQKLIFALVLAAIAAMWAVILAAIPWLWHPLGTQACKATFKGNPKAIRDCMSYNWHSGLEANLPILGQFFALCVLIIGFWHRHNCHQVGCLWPVRHGKTHCPKHEKVAA